MKLPTISTCKAVPKMKTQGNISLNKSRQLQYRSLAKKRTFTKPKIQYTQISNKLQPNQLYIPEEIEDNSISDRQMNINYHRKIYKRKIQKIMESLTQKYSNKQTQNKLDIKSSSKSRHAPVLNKYEEICSIYKAYEESEHNRQQMFAMFLSSVKKQNHFFFKLDDIVVLALFKIGKVRTVQQGKYLYYQSQEAHSFFIILWGQIKLKMRHSKIVKYCIAGDSLSQEILLQKPPTIRKRMSTTLRLINGSKARAQSAKALMKAAVLQIPLKSYELLKKNLAIMGEKDKILLAEKVITWCRTKKTKFRSHWA